MLVCYLRPISSVLSIYHDYSYVHTYSLNIGIQYSYICNIYRTYVSLSTVVVHTVQLDLNLTLASEVHACILWLVPSVFENLPCLYTTARNIAVHNMLRATCKSHHTSMQDTYVISKIMARHESNLKMGRIFMRTHLPLCSDWFYQFLCLPSLIVPANKHVLSTLNY